MDPVREGLAWRYYYGRYVPGSLKMFPKLCVFVGVQQSWEVFVKGQPGEQVTVCCVRGRATRYSVASSLQMLQLEIVLKQAVQKCFASIDHVIVARLIVCALAKYSTYNEVKTA
eukprot:jgi/Ulvmu1/11894/UM081_0053.1